MSKIIIAVLLNQGIRGYRFLDTDTYATIDLPEPQAKQYIQSNKQDIEWVSIENEIIEGTNGKLSRYPYIIDNLPQTSPLIILSKCSDKHYIVSDYKGEIVEMGEESIIGYSLSEGIANGKILDATTDHPYISSISGTYPISGQLKSSTLGEKLSRRLSLTGTQFYSVTPEGILTYINPSLNSVIIPPGVTEIAMGLFDKPKDPSGNAVKSQCKELTLPDSLTTICAANFKGLQLKELRIPSSIRAIKPMSLFGTEITKLILPGNILTLERGIERGISGLKVIEVGQLFRYDIKTWPRGVKLIKRTLKQ